MAALAALDAAWERWFDDQGVAPLRIAYAALSDDPIGVLAQVLDALGLDRGLSREVGVPTARLADAVSLDWRRRYDAERD